LGGKWSDDAQSISIDSLTHSQQPQAEDCETTLLGCLLITDNPEMSDF
jgi:hypothetical protein